MDTPPYWSIVRRIYHVVSVDKLLSNHPMIWDVMMLTWRHCSQSTAINPSNFIVFKDVLTPPPFHWTKWRAFRRRCVFRRILLNKKFCILITFSQNFVIKSPIGNNPGLVQIIACRRIGDKPLFWTNVDLINWRLYGALGGGELNQLPRLSSSFQ